MPVNPWFFLYKWDNPVGIASRPGVYAWGGGMDSDLFIALIKKEIIGQATPGESAQLRRLLLENDDYQQVYASIMNSTKPVDEDIDEAYRKHILRLKRNDLIS